jgi:hypothetical protein
LDMARCIRFSELKHNSKGVIYRNFMFILFIMFVMFIVKRKGDMYIK